MSRKSEAETTVNPGSRGSSGQAENSRPLRRRGRALEEAIYEAVLEELAEHGFGELSIEEIAGRARTGKSAIYRRWATKLDLVMDTIMHTLPDPPLPTSSGSLRADLLRVLRLMARSLSGPAGVALRANIGKFYQHPDLAAAIREKVIAPRLRIMQQLLAAGVERGEVRPEALTPQCAGAGPALLRLHFLEYGPQIPDETITSIVDNVLIPMLSPTHQAGR